MSDLVDLAPMLLDFAETAHDAIWRGGLDADALTRLNTLCAALCATRRHTALAGAAFMVAFRDQDRVFQAGLETADRRQAIEARLVAGLAAMADPEALAESGGSEHRDAAASPVYQALCRQFVDGDLFSVDPPAFAARCRLAWAELLATDAGEPIRAALSATEQGLRSLLALQMMRWRAADLRCPIDALLGNPPLPLQSIYVEPMTEAGTPLLRTLHAWLRDDSHPVAAVCAPAGQGKSLTARVLSSVLAEAWLADDASTDDRGRHWRDWPEDPALAFQCDAWRADRPRSERWFPVYVPCHCRRLDASDLQQAIAHATHAQLAAQGVRRSAADLTSRRPDDQRRLLILDGLVPLDDHGAFADALAGIAGERCRVLLFARPDALPHEAIEPERIIWLQPFGPRQIDAWLAAWNLRRPTAITRAALNARGMRWLAQSPRLLHMLARAWTTLPTTPTVLPVVKAYAAIVDQRITHCIAQTHGPAVRADAERIRAALITQGRLTQAGSTDDALRCLIARLAWAHADEPLTPGALRCLLTAELGVADKAGVSDVSDAFVTAVAELMVGAWCPRGERRFRAHHPDLQDFLIACHWRDELLRPEPDERRLMGARLLARERAAEFVMALLSSPTHRAQAARWAEQCILNPRLGRRTPDGSAYCDDPRRDERGLLREAALMLRCRLDPQPLVIDDGQVLTTLIRGLEIQRRFCLLYAPRVRADDGFLPGANLPNAHLAGARLGRVDLSGADLRDACLRAADLTGADLSRASLTDADLRGANLERADLMYADLANAILQEATLTDADLAFANLQGGMLQDARLAGADLRWANLSAARLSGADLRGVDLRGANLAHADFTVAHLGAGDTRVRNLHLAENLEKAIRPAGWGDLLTQT